MGRLALIGGVLAVLEAGLTVWSLNPDRSEPAGLTVWPSNPDRSEPFVAPLPERAVMGPAMRSGLQAEWATAILARPLFEPGRRPPIRLELVSASQAEAAPRLTGIIVSGAVRRALFAGPEGAVRGEGERLGVFTVTSIRAGAVELAGPEGMRVVSPVDDAEFRAELAVAQALAPLVGAEEREVRTENDQ